MSVISASIISNEINFFSKSKKYCDESVSRNLRDFICHHQGEFIQYTFLAGEYHKEMKYAFGNEQKDRSEIEEKHDQLVEYLNEQIGSIVSSSFNLMQKFFAGRHIKSPRICIKANFDPREKLVIGLFREKKVGYNSDCSVSENKGFNSVKENGRYYLCQNIPVETQKGEYYNPRLIKEAVDNYRPTGKIKRFFQTKNNVFIDEKWINCWQRSSSEDGKTIKPHYRSCYKSTLVIPLTLWNNILNKKFLKKFNLDDVNRTIFGYLCFDHIKANYFNPILDVDMGYVFADILSLYLLIRFIFVNQSATYELVKQFLNNDPYRSKINL
ncbi:hypothetical protein [Desulfosarcina ovata]|uniref:Uncharacterized protein n=1 Tax=Desulfosarcina ovata subsp. ovata TaxID=2752305 RepID=A0A5K8A8X3_9BACT|nr:hypothetical protein [Desulfosarcina ovata]BBO88985.1 hypothetical protein DSCOOX_21650 [Desulfosarcina ovata subsp. ovata]